MTMKVVVPIKAVAPKSTSGAMSAMSTPPRASGATKPFQKVCSDGSAGAPGSATFAVREYHQARAITRASLASSEGWSENPPTFSQRAEPFTLRPMEGTKQSASSRSASENQIHHVCLQRS